MRFARFLICPLILAGIFAPTPVGYGQGSLTPPGPPGPTMKTLAQIEPRTPISTVPFTISAPGSYYLTSNLSGPPGTNGIIVLADDVTLDLNGFTLFGDPQSLAGVTVTGARRNLAIRNGTVRDWAVGIAAGNATHCRFENLRFSGNRGSGVMAGANSVVADCNSYSNEGTGIAVDRESIVRDSIARDNFLQGIHAGFGSQVTGCNASLNSENGILLDKSCRLANSSAFNNSRMGINGGDDSQITDCVAGNNRESGLSAGANSVINKCSATANLASGIVTADGSMLTGCSGSNNGQSGIVAGADVTVDECTTSLNRDHGIVAGGDCQISESKALKNLKSGIRADRGTSIRGCLAQRNGSDGIQVSSDCTVMGNEAKGNFNARDASGIHATGTDNCIKDNNVISNDRGVTADVPGNIILKNSAANNTINYFLVGQQSLGPIFKDKAELEVVNPWTNFEF